MKRNKSSDSLGHLMSMCPPHKEENSPRSDHMYNKEYHSMLDGFEEEGCMGEYGHFTEKKRRLSVDQVKALERNFEVENKLEPERKVKLAKELGLQPRQVAVWFQNRRARWKTKQLERDYGVLKANFDSLHKNYESLKLDKQALLKEIKELKLKVNEEHLEENMSIKEEEISERMKLNYVTDISEDVKLKIKTDSMAFICSELKSDGSSNSDSSGISNDEQSPSSNDFIFPNSKSECLGDTQDNVYHPQFVKLEEHNLFGGDEACNFFAEEQAPSLHWYSADQWA